MVNRQDISILLADFQFLTRKAISSLIEETPGFKIVKIVESPENVLLELKSVRPNLLILEISNNPIQLEEIVGFQGQTNMEILIITNNQNHRTIQLLLEAGIKSILTKSCSKEEIINALKAISIGQRFYCNSILNIAMQSQNKLKKSNTPASLTPRELQILQFIVDGNTTEKIADKLHISVHTVNAHRKNILRKLNITSPMHLVAYAVESGLVSVNYNK